MPDKPTEDTQKTQPRPRDEGKEMPKPFDIPVPSKDQIVKDFEKVVAGRTTEDDSESDDGSNKS